MITVKPVFWDEFECKAGDCKHTCCSGWEIDVDPGSVEYYRQIPGKLGEKLRGSIEEDEEGYHFRMEDDRCPFLQKNGRCRIIRILGEGALCDICALHPRFYEEYGGYELCGLGLSCERVCELLWESDGKLFFLTEEGTEFTFAGQDVTYVPRKGRDYLNSLFNRFRQTEPIDDGWTAEMVDYDRHFDALCDAVVSYAESFDRGRYNRLFSYVIYRQLEKVALDEWSVEKLIEYGRRATDFIFATDAYRGDPLERIRRFSEQIEYSTENVEIIA
ncbi:MAG: flagellin lysine-N-methylase [Lachnospiraceae bacterium]|nr:flagellin lysine-N-methylase [Lachnospiraceae bacterium]